MAETAKILNPTKKVLLPDLNAGCSLADSCPPEAFRELKKQYPDHVVVTYINCSAEIKTLSGANRLASNSLLEALVFSHQASQIVIQELDGIPFPGNQKSKVLWKKDDEPDDEIIAGLRKRLNEIMTYDLLQSAPRREKTEACEQLQELQDILDNYPPFNSGTVALYELRNMVQTAILILKDAIDHPLPKKGILKGIL